MPTGFIESLNSPQKEAVLFENGPMLILAGAGSGKTRVLTHRIAHLVQNHHVMPWQILAVTFTNKAAREMKERLSKLLGAAADALWVSTFHSAAARVLRTESEAVGLSRSFVIYDEADQLSLLRRLLREMNAEEYNLSPRDMLGFIDKQKNEGKLPEELGEEPEEAFLLEGAEGGLSTRAERRLKRWHFQKRLYELYQKQLTRASAVDFGDLMVLWVKLLRDNEALRQKYQHKFRHVLVDEFQDTNAVQWSLLKLLVPPEGNLVVVGDDDQSIYRWRGADVRNLLGFSEAYPGAKLIKLEQNYRSFQNILDAAHAVISKNRRRMGKRLWTERDKGPLVGMVVAHNERVEAQEVVLRIHKLSKAEGIPLSEVAVFFRTHAQSRVLEESLRMARVPYVLLAGRSFWERAEVKDAIAYFRVMANPYSDVDVLRIVNIPTRGIGDTTIERLLGHARKKGISFYEALLEHEEVEGLNALAKKRIVAFSQLLGGLILFAKESPPAAVAAEHMLQETGLLSNLMQEGGEEAQGRADNLRELVSAALEFDKNHAASSAVVADDALESLPPLEAFLEQMSLLSEVDTEDGQGKVSLMTLHAAKGLEFDVVFMTGMEEEVFPHRRATGVEADEEEMEEERRLCYVGFTRARKKLFLSLAQSRTLFGELRFNAPSRFLLDVPQHLFEPHPMLTQKPPTPQASKQHSPGWRVVKGEDYCSEDYSQHTDNPVGARVFHAQFGKGKVLSSSGMGANAKLTVRFETVGVKTVIARFLQLA
ncbi:MAG: UvrD-helicase domain-containing protein [Proteobacteria bacterium]|nr:UvrD-helicase domain-containing protein [Cystobacterineae bacterium]MCL2258771.1 UvrD-helicase domain-containing protein [Cystobacterineae bacterium]MCL2314398.1 UvrD-helicase domain-containing protein [Pseudomonadota bacterium]